MSAVLKPRLVSRTEAASYCGLKPSRFSELVKHGMMPRAIPGTNKWDMRAIDLHLDKVSGIQQEKPQSALERWKAQQNAGTA